MARAMAKRRRGIKEVKSEGKANAARANLVKARAAKLAKALTAK